MSGNSGAVHTAEIARQSLADPQSPWRRGSNENTNGLRRQYWPKGADLRDLTPAECERIALKLNTRPRKTLDWQTPAQALNPRLA